MNIIAISAFEYLEPWLDLNWSRSSLCDSLGQSRPTLAHQGYPLCYCIPLILSHSTWIPLGFCLRPLCTVPLLRSFRYVSTEMAHNLYFIRPWYNWWQWGKVMPSGGLVFPPVFFFFTQSPQTAAPQSRCGLNTMRQMQWVWCHCFLRGVGTHSALERSNYSACIYFEKHAGSSFIQHWNTFWSESLSATTVMSHWVILVSESWK